MINLPNQNQSQRGKNQFCKFRSLVEFGLIFLLVLFLSSIGPAIAAKIPEKNRTKSASPSEITIESQ